MEAAASNYTAMARRFRPQTFDQVVGQQHVARALKNAIAGGRVAHAYLFTGARGVGKTSMARILAKALNCPNAVDGVPCNECDICRGISAGNDVDVLEIDGASNRGIDDIRTLRANVNVRSMRTRYKLYIIDEVHMLTKEAFNALLKTLEEPPPSVKFVFCTTEPNKVPDTILSRCQRFDFSTIETQRIIERLAEIARTDGFEVEPAALELVARRANGSMRDSQSLFDQLLAFGQDRITAADVHRLLGTASDDRLMDLAEALIARSQGTALELFDRALNEGVQIGEFVDQLVYYLRDLMIVVSGADGVLLVAVSSENRERLAGQARRWGLQTVLAALQILAEARGRMARVTFERPVAELALVRIALLEDLEQIGMLVEELRNGRPVTAQSATAAKSRASSPAGGPTTPSETPGAGSAAQKKSAPDAVRSGSPPSGEAAPAPKSANASMPADPQGHNRESPPVEAAQPALRALEPGTEADFWRQVLERLDDMARGHAKVARSSAISGPNGLDVLFPWSYHFSKQYCERPEVLARLERAAAELAGRPIRIRFAIDADEPAAESESASREASRPVPEQPDEFVGEALSVFGATIVKVEPLAASSAASAR